MRPPAPGRQAHAVLDLPSRRLKALKIEHLLNLVSDPQPLRLLEIGTGSGGISHYFATHPGLACEVTAVDTVDQRLLREGFDFHRVEGTKLPFPDASFDVVITNHVIEHVGDLNAQRHHLQEVHRILRTTGVGYLAVPNRWMIIEPHFRLPFLSWLSRSLRSPYLHLARRGKRYDCEPLSLGQLERLLTETRFEYRNLGVQAWREMLAIEGGRGLLNTAVRRLPNLWIARLAPLVPTLIYRLIRNP